MPDVFRIDWRYFQNECFPPGMDRRTGLRVLNTLSELGFLRYEVLDGNDKIITSNLRSSSSRIKFIGIECEWMAKNSDRYWKAKRKRIAEEQRKFIQELRDGIMGK